MDQFIKDKQAEYKEKAKKADRQLRELEKRAAKENSKEYLRYAYSRAQRDIKTHGGKTRFDINPSDDIDELMAMIADVDRFLGATTNTYRGFQRLNKQRAKAFNKTNNTSFTYEEFVKLTELGVFDTLKELFDNGQKGFGYRTAIKVSKSIIRNKKNIMNRKNPISEERLIEILKKYKFRDQPGLYEIVQGMIN